MDEEADLQERLMLDDADCLTIDQSGAEGEPFDFLELDPGSAG